MSGMEFEDHVARIARSCGVPVIMTAVTGDWGVDLIVGNRPDRLAVQCKRQSRPVGAGAVQEVVAGAPMHGCTKTMVVTNHEFTPAARKLAELHGCELVGGSELTAAAFDDPAAHRRRPKSGKRVPHSGDGVVDLAVRHRQRRTEPDTVGAAGQHDDAAIPQLADQLVALLRPRAG